MSKYIYNELADRLYDRVRRIYEMLCKESKIDVFGLDLEIVDRFNKDGKIAVLKGNKILIRIDAINLPDEALKYIIAHELAHTFCKAHTERFWDILKVIYPEFEKGKEILRVSRI
jgi:Zn-dependent peptidase ImmA (M78 family)